VTTKPFDLRSHPSEAVLLGFLLLVVLPAVLAFFFVGFQASDDINYLNGALGWLDHFPYVGDDHWTLRHTITIPTALAISVFGLNEFAVAFAGMAYFAAFVWVNAYFTWRYLSPAAAVVATALMLTLPGFPIVGTYLSPDVPELFFVSLSFWLFRRALDDDGRMRFWLWCGLVAGLGYINRPTAAAFPLFVAAMWLVRPSAPRLRYMPMAAAFIAIVGMEWLYLTAMTHQPLYRQNIDLHHDVVDRFASAAEVAGQHRLIDREGNLSLNVWIDPILALFVSQKYVLVFWLSLPGVVAAWRRRREPVFLTLAMLAGLGLTAFLFVAVNPKLYLVPRYFIVPAWAAATVAGWWLAGLWTTQRGNLALVVLAVAVGANLLSLSIEDTKPRAAERSLVGWVKKHPDTTVYTDIETRARSEFLFRFAGVSQGKVSDDRPPAGALFFYNAQRVDQCAAAKRCRERANDFRPAASWKVEATLEAPLRPGVALLRALGLRGLLPADITRRLFEPAGNVVVYRVGA
jgi:Dolichyl-phosphate-mannose-protein mannosyltransferase